MEACLCIWSCSAKITNHSKETQLSAISCLNKGLNESAMGCNATKRKCAAKCFVVLIDCCRVFKFISRSYCVLFVSRSCSHIHLSLYLCCFCWLICQTAGSREFAAARSQVEKYQRDFWWVNAVGTKIKGLQKKTTQKNSTIWKIST